MIIFLAPTHKLNSYAVLGLAKNEPCYVFSNDVDLQTTTLVQQSLRWTPTSHDLFPFPFRRGVQTVLLVRYALERQELLPILSESLWLEIIARLERPWGFGT